MLDFNRNENIHRTEKRVDCESPGPTPERQRGNMKITKSRQGSLPPELCTRNTVQSSYIENM
jgi:hypothetical protein